MKSISILFILVCLKTFVIADSWLMAENNTIFSKNRLYRVDLTINHTEKTSPSIKKLVNDSIFIK